MQLEPAVELVVLVKMERTVQQVQPVYLVKMATQDQQEARVQLGRLDPREIKVPQVLLVSLARLV